MFKLAITDGVQTIAGSQHGCLRDARAELIRYQNRRGLYFTVNLPYRHGDLEIQEGVLRTGMQIVGTWSISYPLPQEVSA